MIGRVNIPCRNPTRNFIFILDDGRRVLCKAPSEEEAAAKIPTIYGDGVKWAEGRSGKMYTF